MGNTEGEIASTERDMAIREFRKMLREKKSAIQKEYSRRTDSEAFQEMDSEIQKYGHRLLEAIRSKTASLPEDARANSGVQYFLDNPDEKYILIFYIQNDCLQYWNTLSSVHLDTLHKNKEPEPPASLVIPTSNS